MNNTPTHQNQSTTQKKMLKQNTECTEEQQHPIPQKRLFSIFLTGPPGAGKTTQLQYIEDHFSHYSNVVMSQNKTLKKEAIGAYIKTKSKKPMKQQLLNALSQQGKLTCCRMVTKKVRGIKNDSSSSSENEKPVVWVYSRGPSSVEQAQFLFDYYDICPDLYIVLEMNSVQRLIDRVTHRRVDPVTNRTYNRLIHTESLEEHVQQRLICRAVDELSSVDEKVFMKRMNKYHQRMEPVISYYQALNEQSTSKYVNILHVDATQNPEDVWNEIQTAINKLMHKNRSQIDAYNNNIQQLLPNPSLTSKVSDEEDSSSLSSSPSDDEEAPLSHSSSEESLLWV